MSSKEIHVIATLFPKPGKMDELVKVFDEMAEKVRANEPGTLVYYAVRPKQGDELFIVEKYKDVTALNTHGNSSYFKAFTSAVKPLVSAPPKIVFGRHAGGFQGQSSSSKL